MRQMFLVQRKRMGNDMSRLIAFGCSFTYGESLPDCKIGNNSTGISANPSPHSWPYKLGEMLQIEAINKGIPGSSNLEILYHILHFDFRPSDIVVIMWSFLDRELYFNSTNTFKPYKQLGSWIKNLNPYEIQWLSNINRIDSAVKSWYHIHHADLYLQSLNLKYIHYPLAFDELKEFKPPFIQEIDNFYTEGFVRCDVGDDKSHPGIKSHLETAKKLYKILNE